MFVQTTVLSSKKPIATSLGLDTITVSSATNLGVRCLGVKASAQPAGQVANETNTVLQQISCISPELTSLEAGSVAPQSLTW